MTIFVPDINFDIKQMYLSQSGELTDSRSLTYSTTHRKILFKSEIAENYMVEIKKGMEVDLQIHSINDYAPTEESVFCKFRISDEDLCIASINLDRDSFDEFSAFFQRYYDSEKENLHIGVGIETPKGDIMHTVEMKRNYVITDFTYGFKKHKT